MMAAERGGVVFHWGCDKCLQAAVEITEARKR